MSRGKLYLFLVFLFVTSSGVACFGEKNKAINKSVVTQQNQKTDSVIDISQTLSPAHSSISKSKEKCQSIIVSDTYSSGIYGVKVFTADTSVIKRLFFKNVTMLVFQDEDQGYKYFRYSYLQDSNKISFIFKPSSGLYIEDGEIHSRGIKLNGGIQVGMNKRDFAKLFDGRKIPCDSIVVSNEEGTIENTFIFDHQKLKSIYIASVI